ncbi:MAG: hypothetical protein AAGI38_06015 [Bacteroidota bacterium]
MKFSIILSLIVSVLALAGCGDNPPKKESPRVKAQAKAEEVFNDIDDLKRATLTELDNTKSYFDEMTDGFQNAKIQGDSLGAIPYRDFLGGIEILEYELENWENEMTETPGFKEMLAGEEPASEGDVNYDEARAVQKEMFNRLKSIYDGLVAYRESAEQLVGAKP